MVQISSKKGLIWAKRGRKGGLSPLPADLGFFLRLKYSVECPLSENMYFLQKKFFGKMGGSCPPCEGRGCPPGNFFSAHDNRLDISFQNIYSFIMKYLHRPSLLRTFENT